MLHQGCKEGIYGKSAYSLKLAQNLVYMSITILGDGLQQKNLAGLTKMFTNWNKNYLQVIKLVHGLSMERG
jgi:hypothetical protein